MTTNIQYIIFFPDSDQKMYCWIDKVLKENRGVIHIEHLEARLVERFNFDGHPQVVSEEEVEATAAIRDALNLFRYRNGFVYSKY